MKNETCPFCGGDDIETEEVMSHAEPKTYVARCENCYATGPQNHVEGDDLVENTTPSGALMAWTQRFAK